MPRGGLKADFCHGSARINADQKRKASPDAFALSGEIFGNDRTGHETGRAAGRLPAPVTLEAPHCGGFIQPFPSAWQASLIVERQLAPLQQGRAQPEKRGRQQTLYQVAVQEGRRSPQSFSQVVPSLVPE